MDDVHSNTRLPGQLYGAVNSWTLTLLLYDVDRVVEPLQEACLEYLLSSPLGFVPLLDNPQRIVALVLPLLVVEWEKYQEVSKVQHLCHQKRILYLVFERTYKNICI
jgi:hypothetical protein